MPMNANLATAAIVLGLGIAPALAAGPLSPEATGASFAALSGVPAEAMSDAEMAAVEGRLLTLRFSPSRLSSSGGGFTTLILTSRNVITSDSSNLSFTAMIPHPKWSETSNPPGRFTGWSAP